MTDHAANRPRSRISRRARLGAVGLSVLLLAAASPVMGQSPASGPVALNWWTITPNMGTDGIEAVIADFEAANPGVTITYTGRPDQQYKDSLAQAVQTEAAPDIYEVPYGTGFNQAYAREGASLPIDAYYAQYGWDGRFSQALIDRMTVDGKKYNVPWGGFPFGLYYNKDVFQKAGITAPPATYAELVDDFAKIKASGAVPVGLAGKGGLATGWFTTNLLMQACGWDKYNALITVAAKWDGEPCVTKAYTDFKDWVDKGYFPDGWLALSPDNGQGDALVLAGKAGSIFAGVWFPSGITKAGLPEDQFGLFAFPTDAGAVPYGGSQLAIATKSKNPDVAAKFLDYLTSVDVQTKYYGKINQGFSLVNGVTPPADADPFGPVQTAMAAAAKHLYPPSDGQLSADVNAALVQATDQVALGTLQPAQVGAAVDAAAAKK
jgi:raffinose/stachyose/melibiose transport system substrate-binding protein